MEAAIVRGRSSSWEVESGIALLFSESVVGGLGDGDDILVFCRVGGWGLDWERRRVVHEKCCLRVTLHSLTRLKITKSQACDWTPISPGSTQYLHQASLKSSRDVHFTPSLPFLHNAFFQTRLSPLLHSEKNIQLLTYLPLPKVGLKIRSISRQALHHHGSVSRNRRSDCKAVCRRRR
jgi:hypothetical protein